MKTIYFFIIKELLQLKRDPKMFAIVLLAPILQSIFLGYAATFDVNNINTVIMNLDKSVLSREYIQRIERSGYFTIRSYTDSYDDLTDKLDKSKALVGIVIPDDFEKDIQLNRPASLQVIVDGSDGNKGSIAFGYIQAITSEFSQKIIADAYDRRGMRINMSSIEPAVRVWYNPELKTRNFMVPSIAALILTIITALLTSLAIVKEKEIGTLEQLIVTPIKSYQMILGKLLPFIITGFATVFLVLSVMVFWFGIPVRGSLIFLLFASLLFIMSTLGLGLFVSTISKTQQQAMMITVFGVIMPMIYLSGFAFPIENMPRLIQYVTYLIPLKYFLIILRGVVLKGIGLSSLYFETFMLFIMGVLILFASALRFHKRME